MPASEDDINNIFNYLVEQGALVLKGLNQLGDPVYTVTEKCADIFPEFYKTHKESLSNTAQGLWMKGLIDIIITEDDERIVFNETHFDALKIYIDEGEEPLTMEEVDFLSTLGAPIELNIVEEEPY